MGKRSFTRVRLQSSAIVTSGQMEIHGEVENLSLNGVRLKTPQKLDCSKAVKVKIVFRSASSELWVKIPGRVIRHEGDGMVIQFTKLSLDSYVHLRNVISNLLGDEHKVSGELFAYLTGTSPKGQSADSQFDELCDAQVDRQLTPQ